MRRRALVLALGLCACNDLPDVVAEGAHVVVSADPELEMCGGSLAYLDEFVARFADELSIPAPTGEDRVHISWLVDERFHARSHCPKLSAACTGGRHVFSTELLHGHELVHAVTHDLGNAPPLLLEGIAVAYAGIGAVSKDFFAPPEEPRRDLKWLIGVVDLIRVNGYDTAGAFTAFLIEEHGIADYLRVYSSLAYLAGELAIDRSFRDVFGVSLEQSEADFAAKYDNCEQFYYDRKLVECNAPELEWEHGRLVVHRTFTCEQDDVVGPFPADGQLWQEDSMVVFHTFTVAEAGEYELTMIGPFGYEVSIVQCDAGCGSEPETRALAGLPRHVSLSPGRYSLRLRGQVGMTDSIGVRIEPLTETP